MGGDSHAVEFYSFIKERIEIKQFKTFGGYGLCSFVDPESKRAAGPSHKKHFKNFFTNIEKKSIVLISATDADVRIGLGNRFKDSKFLKENFYKFYKESLEQIIKDCDPYKLILLDFYPLVSKPTRGEQNISDEKRILARDIFLEVMTILNFDCVKVLTVHKDGIIHNQDGTLIDTAIARDPAHFNLGYKLLSGQVIGDYLLGKVQEALADGENTNE